MKEPSDYKLHLLIFLCGADDTVVMVQTSGSHATGAWNHLEVTVFEILSLHGCQTIIFLKKNEVNTINIVRFITVILPRSVIGE